jgi:UDPglucose 6-dehydrogenase/GDP-mannose 6-dehydrogenase
LNVSIVGTGYVGLVSGACLATLGHRVICVDEVASRVDMISRGSAPFSEKGLDQLVAAAVSTGQLSATCDLTSAIRETDLTFLTVGTPETNGEIDLSQIRSAARDTGQSLRTKGPYHVVAVKSTVVPGTTDGAVLTELEAASGKRIGQEIGLCMNPEFLREGEAVDDFMNPDRIVIGAFDERSANVLERVYTRFECPKLVTTLRNAEFIKYSSNALLALCISFANEFAGLCEGTPGTDVELILDGLHMDRRLSPIVSGAVVRPGILSYLRPSSGYGGSCLPKDIEALRGFARKHDLATPLMDAVAVVNASRTPAVLDLAEDRLGLLAGKRVAVLGLTFKAGTDDLRNSPALVLVEGLLERGASVVVHDPIATDSVKPFLGDRVKYAVDPESAVSESEIVIIGAAWPQWRALDWGRLGELMRDRVVFDPRNALRGVDLPVGFTRVGIGAGRPESPA